MNRTKYKNFIAARQYSAGFTLIEMMIVIVIAAIILTFAVPSFQNALDRHRLKSVAETIRSDLELMKLESIKRSAIVTFSIRNDNAATGDWCYGLSQSNTCNCKTSSSCTLDNTSKVVSYDSFQGIKITAPSTTSPTPFDIRVEQVRGTVTLSAALTNNRIRLTSQRGKELDIEISALGRFVICSPSGASNVMGYPTCT